ncbi:pseudouridine synthase [Bacteroides reticulotermitis]|uniref:Pseudouridine synthase n=2 Tax=Bacteroides reticulotermitis TaxID=1133319 RepID=W4UMQ1_9BACE|nr:pseudouridine synthase [Bacteroides reticulotermitis]MBB4042634.1 23S rRNA pseudouridine2605 synthase [Bacteroides reticulotermitis]GAE82241.1 ribosomal large subunit pseudouridine synthase B [Bacteroides reticulotermitis JCM 10512]
MNTENEEWRENSSNEENSGAGRDGNKYYNREGSGERPYRPSYNREGGDRPAYNREGSSDRPYRPRFNPNREGGDRPSYNREGGGDRPYRPRFNSGNEGGDRPQRPYGDRPQRPSYNREGGDRPSYNREGGSDRPYRPSYNREGGDRPSYNREGGDRPQRPYGDRPQRPSYNREGGDRPSYNREGGSDRPYRPSYNREGGGDRPYRPYNREGGDRPSYNREGGDRPYRPSYNRDGGGDRPYRPRYDGGGSHGFSRPVRRSGDYDPNAKYSKKKQIEYKEQYVDPNEPIRLNKFLANAGICSRREADEFIIAGVVTVNDVAVTELGTKIKRSDVVKFHDEAVSIERKVYVLLNKPKDTVTTSDDPQERRTVMDLVKGACTERIYPVGRLDRNTTGVLLLTNDGDLASKLTHPKFLKKKIYHVHLDKNLTKADMEQIAAGVQLEDGEIRADGINYADDFKKDQVGIEIHSGKNRIVRRIFESLGYKVIKLDRVFFAGLTKKGLRRGEWRYLSEAEVNFLRMGSFE